MIANRLRKLVGNRRRARRHVARRRVRLLFSASRPGAGPQPAIEGYTRDVSLTGIAFVVPDAQTFDRDAGESLEVTLELRGTSVRLRAHPVRSQPLAGGGHLVAVEITQMGEGDCALLARHLEGLRRRVGRYAP